MRRFRTTGTAVLAASMLVLVACGEDTAEPQAEGGGESAAAEYPTQRMTLIVPYAAGGPITVLGQTVGTCLEEEFGQTVVVDNRPGASGSVGMQAMLAAGNDGHTISVIAVPASATNPLQADVGYTNEDYVPVAVGEVIPSVLAVGEGSQFADAEAFFQYARENPGELTVGTPGATTSQAMELMRMAQLYGVEVTAVPFNGNAEMTTALLGGNVDAVFINSTQDVLENIEAGSFVPLAVSPEERVDYIDAPTLAEVGFPELVYSTSVWGFAAPAGVPDGVVPALESAIENCLSKEETVEVLGEQYVPEEFIGSEAFSAMIDDIVEVYGPVLQD
ncbi:tripartite tricarboxylate transporter substrate binding protein [Blastococcus sp. HT6-30]|uniref:tripartite tricarboxylate transporter substrate binding protein n=1 Tax=Blastococcus sp. HT6-30 TaxID=3144843 RepID=UPI0032196A03